MCIQVTAVLVFINGNNRAAFNLFFFNVDNIIGSFSKCGSVRLVLTSKMFGSRNDIRQFFFNYTTNTIKTATVLTYTYKIIDHKWTYNSQLNEGSGTY